MSRETVLITGASSGIGLELARLFAADGSNLILVARSEDRLHTLARSLESEHGIRAHVLPCDLTKHDAPQWIADRLRKAEVTVDVLVNNAGFGAWGDFIDITLERQLDMLQVNVTALTHLTRLFLPGMVNRRRGGILNVGSLAAFQAGPSLAVYSATKAYVQSFTEALAEELKGSGVTATCLAPGPTNTNFQMEAKMGDAVFFRLAGMDARPVARAGYEAFRKGRVYVIPGMLNRLAAIGSKLAPRALSRKVARLANH